MQYRESVTVFQWLLSGTYLGSSTRLWKTCWFALDEWTMLAVPDGRARRNKEQNSGQTRHLVLINGKEYCLTPEKCRTFGKSRLVLQFWWISLAKYPQKSSPSKYSGRLFKWFKKMTMKTAYMSEALYRICVRRKLCFVNNCVLVS